MDIMELVNRIKKKEKLNSFSVAVISGICLTVSILFAYLFSKFYPYDVKEIIQIRLVIYTLIGGFILLYMVYLNLKAINIDDDFYKTPEINNILSTIYIFITCFIIANLFIRSINALDYTSAETITIYRIDDKQNTVRDEKYRPDRRSRRTETRQVRNYYFILKEKDNPKADTKKIEVNSRTYSDAEIGDDYIVKVKPGVLGLLHYSSSPEIIHNHEYEKVWAERRKQWKEK